MEKNEPPFQIDRRSIKIALYGFLIVLLATMFFLKPYLPRAIFHNFAKIDDYRFFSNRIVKAPAHGLPWKIAANPKAGPTAETQALLDSLQTTALLMIDNNEIAYEKYSLTGGVGEISGSFSMAKTIIGLLTGFALQDHRIRSLDEPASVYITEWADYPMGKIKVKDLLTMSSGLNWNESYANPFSITTEAYYGTNLLQTTFKQFSEFDPGTLFSYQSGTTQVLGLLLARATNKHLAQYASEKLWGPLGAEQDALWSLDQDEGMEKAYCCFNARARDFAKIGQLMLNDGLWPNEKGEEQELLNSDYLKQMTTPSMIPDENGQPVDYYGYSIWLMKTAQGNVYYARGILGQYIIVVPEKRRVVVRLGMKKGKTIEHHPEEVRALVDWALH